MLCSFLLFTLIILYLISLNFLLRFYDFYFLFPFSFVYFF